jgi:hypothetical protein
VRCNPGRADAAEKQTAALSAHVWAGACAAAICCCSCWAMVVDAISAGMPISWECPPTWPVAAGLHQGNRVQRQAAASAQEPAHVLPATSCLSAPKQHVPHTAIHTALTFPPIPPKIKKKIPT